MINTAPPASNSVYGREKWFWYNKINLSKHVCHCGAVVGVYINECKICNKFTLHLQEKFPHKVTLYILQSENLAIN